MADDDVARHREKKQKISAAREKIMAKKTEERGLLIVHTGTGKGKSSAAMGMVLRAISHGFPVSVTQFIKGARTTGERDGLCHLAAARGTRCDWFAIGEGFTWETKDLNKDLAIAQACWNHASTALADPALRLVLLDELNIALRYNYLALDPVLTTLRARPHHQHAIVTGRNAPQALCDAADLVTDMTLVKHPFKSGVKAQAGIEF